MKRILIVMVLLWLVAGPSVQAHQGHHEDTDDQLSIDPGLLGFTAPHVFFNIHPAFVHFPIALFPSALLLYGLGLAMKRRSWIVAGRACLYLAVAGTAAAILSGLRAEDSFPHTERIHHMMMTHWAIGVMIGVCAAVLTGWSFLQRDQQPTGVYGFLLLLTVTTYLVLQNGDLGSRMVYLEGAAVKPVVSMMTESETHHEESDPHHEESAPASPHHHTH